MTSKAFAGRATTRRTIGWGAAAVAISAVVAVLELSVLHVGAALEMTTVEHVVLLLDPGLVVLAYAYVLRDSLIDRGADQ